MNPFSSLLIAIRHASKNQLSSLINICGLAIGLAAFTAIMLYVEHELSFDRFHSRYEDTYRVVKDFVMSDGTAIPDATTPPALAKAMLAELPDVEAVTRFSPSRGRLFLLQQGDKRHYETSLINVDKEFFKVFDFEFIAGNREKSLDQVHSMVLTQSTARKYFDSEDPIGKTIKMNINGGTDYIVTGVLKDVPDNSHFKFNIIIPIQSRRDPDTDWQRNSFYTYARVKPGADANSLLSGVRDIVKANLPNTLDLYHLQALGDIHLHSNLKMELSANGDMSYIRILVLLVASSS
jgi:putative ABC transport system permease protein